MHILSNLNDHLSEPLYIHQNPIDIHFHVHISILSVHLQQHGGMSYSLKEIYCYVHITSILNVRLSHYCGIIHASRASNFTSENQIISMFMYNSVKVYCVII